MKSLIKNWVIHLFLFPVLFVLNHFGSIVFPQEILTSKSFFIIVLTFTASVILCILPPFLFFKVLSTRIDKVKASILTTLIFFPFFFFQDIFLSTEEMMVGVRLRWLIPALLIILIALFYLILKIKNSFSSLNEGLNIISLVLVVYVTIVLILSFDRLKPKSFNFIPKVSDLTCNDCPDIYFILLDSYTSNKSLRDYFSFDNSSFTNNLNKFGFTVADQAISPYSSTNKCMASILNLNQSDDLDRFENNFGVHELIHSNVVTKSLEELGYEIKNYSLFDIGEQPKYYSLLPSCGVAFIDGVMKNSILGMGLRYYQEQKFYDLHADILNKMPVSSDKPTFFYAHILAPHPPFVIDSAGNNIRFFGQRHRISTNSYTEQLQGLNGMVLESVQRILEESPKSMVIIMGDHGYRFIDKQEAFTVFLAYKGPNSKDITALKYSSEIFKLVMKEFSAGIN